MATRITKIRVPRLCSIGDLYGLRLLQKHGEEKFPGVATAPVEFYDLGTYPDNTWMQYLQQGTFIIGIDSFRIQRGRPACVSVAEALGLIDHVFYGWLVQRMVDASNLSTDPFSINNILRDVWRYNSTEILPFARTLFRAIEEKQRYFLKTRHLQTQQTAKAAHEAARRPLPPPPRRPRACTTQDQPQPPVEVAHQGREPYQRFAVTGGQNPLFAAIVTTDDEIGALDVQSFGVAILVCKRTAGHMDVFCFDSSVDLIYLVKELRKESLRNLGMSRKKIQGLNQDHLMASGIIPEVPDLDFRITTQLQEILHVALALDKVVHLLKTVVAPCSNPNIVQEVM